MHIADALIELGKLRTFFPVNRIEDETLLLYAAELVDQDPSDLSRACATLAKSQEWFPVLAVILRACADIRAVRRAHERRIAEAEERAADAKQRLAEGPPLTWTPEHRARWIQETQADLDRARAESDQARRQPPSSDPIVYVRN